MNKVVMQLTLLVASFGLAACSNNSFFEGSSKSQRADNAMQGTGATTQMASGQAVGGNISRTMDENDKSKLSHALDKPLGKPTQWVNQNTGTTYTVVPTEKLAINGNPYCRKYTLTALRGGNTHEVNGTACVAASNSNWESIS